MTTTPNGVATPSTPTDEPDLFGRRRIASLLGMTLGAFAVGGCSGQGSDGPAEELIGTSAAALSNLPIHIASSIADLRALTDTSHDVYVLGYHAPNDGGGGLFYWVQGSSAPDDGGLVIAPAGSMSSNGRWLRVYDGALNVKWFGAVGARLDAPNAPLGPTDDTVGFKRALKVIGDRTDPSGGPAYGDPSWPYWSGVGALYVPPGVYVLTETLKLPRRTTLFGDSQRSSILRFTHAGTPNDVRTAAGILATNDAAGAIGSEATHLRHLVIENRNAANVYGAGIDFCGGCDCSVVQCETINWKCHVALDGLLTSVIDQHLFGSRVLDQLGFSLAWFTDDVGLWFVFAGRPNGFTLAGANDGGQPNNIRVTNSDFKVGGTAIKAQAGAMNSIHRNAFALGTHRIAEFRGRTIHWTFSSNYVESIHEAGTEYFFFQPSTPGAAQRVAETLTFTDNWFSGNDPTRKPLLLARDNARVVGLVWDRNWTSGGPAAGLIQVASGGAYEGPITALASVSHEAPLFGDDLPQYDSGPVLVASSAHGSTGSRFGVGINVLRPAAQLDIRHAFEAGANDLKYLLRIWEQGGGDLPSVPQRYFSLSRDAKQIDWFSVVTADTNTGEAIGSGEIRLSNHVDAEQDSIATVPALSYELPPNTVVTLTLTSTWAHRGGPWAGSYEQRCVVARGLGAPSIGPVPADMVTQNIKTADAVPYATAFHPPTIGLSGNTIVVRVPGAAGFHLTWQVVATITQRHTFGTH